MFKEEKNFNLRFLNAFGGKGISKITKDEQRTIVFIPNAFPGQKVEAIISAKKKKYAEAKLLEVLKTPIEKVNDFQKYLELLIYIFESKNRKT